MITVRPEGWVYLRLTGRNGAPLGVTVAVDLGTLPPGAVLDDEQLTQRSARMIRAALADLSGTIPIRGDGGPLILHLAAGAATGAAAA